ncbi:MAG: NHL repeat-containing protein [bacterium]
MKKLAPLFVASVLLFVVCREAAAMGEVPKTTTLVTPTLEFVKEIGMPGSGERQFYYPQDIKVAAIGDIETGLGDLFIADTGNNRIERVSEDGRFVYQFGGFGMATGKFNTPWGVAVDFNYRLYVSERDGDRVQLFDIRGNFLNTVGAGEYNFKTLRDPAGMDVDQLGNLYLADSGNDRVLKFDSSGNFAAETGGFGLGLGFLNRPMDVAVDRDRSYFIADTGNNRIQKFDQNDRGVSIIGDGILNAPQSVALDEQFLYVADTGNNRICIFAKSGELVLDFGKKGSGQGEFNAPMGISLGPKGRLFVADNANHRIVELKISY